MDYTYEREQNGTGVEAIATGKGLQDKIRLANLPREGHQYYIQRSCTLGDSGKSFLVSYHLDATGENRTPVFKEISTFFAPRGERVDRSYDNIEDAFKALKDNEEVAPLLKKAGLTKAKIAAPPAEVVEELVRQQDRYNVSLSADRLPHRLRELDNTVDGLAATVSRLTQTGQEMDKPTKEAISTATQELAKIQEKIQSLAPQKGFVGHIKNNTGSGPPIISP